MPDPIAPTASPAPPVTPTPPTAPVMPPGAPQPPPPPRPEDDPNHQMALLIAKRREKQAGEEGKTAQPPTKSEPKTPSGEPPKEPEKLGNLIANALKFRRTEPKKPDEPVKGAPPAASPAAEPTKEPPKTVVSKKKPAPDLPDAATIASQAAAAATTAAVNALRPAPSLQPDPGENLKGQEKREYEVAQYLASRDPRFKNAPAIILDHVKKADQYAARWEAANQGKLFDPADEEHNAFFESLEKPWASDDEFEEVRIEMLAERVADKKTAKSEARLRQLESDNARLELAPAVERKFREAAGTLAKSLGDEVIEKVSKEGFDGLAAYDPITADVLAETLQGLQPIIETIIQIDDPKGRISLDLNNPLHQQWNEIVNEGEARCLGLKDEQGRVFARRSDYKLMNESQRARHWFLTPDHLVAGIIDETSKLVGNYLKTEKERQKKIAESLGYIPKSTSAASAPLTSPSIPASALTPDPGPQAAMKPTSPTVGSGAKIDDTTKPPATGRAALMDAISNVLWKR